MSNVTVREAREGDLGAIFGILNHEIRTSFAIFDLAPIENEDEQRAWLTEHGRGDRPAIVAERDGEVIGWGSVSDWSTRCCYARAGEVSVYVREDARGVGAGKALLEGLVERGRAGGVGVLLARIATTQEASLRLHRSVGFVEVGVMHGVGEKFGRVLDVCLMEAVLGGNGGGAGEGVN